jgi:hypothetical protein
VRVGGWAGGTSGLLVTQKNVDTLLILFLNTFEATEVKFFLWKKNNRKGKEHVIPEFPLLFV